jgi:hypothetical protein
MDAEIEADKAAGKAEVAKIQAMADADVVQDKGPQYADVYAPYVAPSPRANENDLTAAANYTAIHAGEDTFVTSLVAAELDGFVYGVTDAFTLSLNPVKNVTGQQYGSGIENTKEAINLVAPFLLGGVGEVGELFTAGEELAAGEQTLATGSNLITAEGSEAERENLRGRENQRGRESFNWGKSKGSGVV